MAEADCNTSAIDKFDEAHLALVRAKSILDLIYTLSLSNNRNKMEGLWDQSLHTCIDMTLHQLHVIEEFFDLDVASAVGANRS